jgi:hypothetical protein
MQGVKANIDREQILQLAARFWTPRQIGAFFRVSERTIYNYVSAEELAEAREKGRGDLIELAWERARTDKSPTILLHMLQFHRDEMPTIRRELASVSNEELAEEITKRIAASKMIKQGGWKKALSDASDVKQLPEATGQEKPSGDRGDVS